MKITKGQIVIGVGLLVVIVLLIVSTLLNKQESKKDYSKFDSNVAEDMETMTVKEADEYMEQMKENQNTVYKDASYVINLNNYEVVENISDSFQSVASVDVSAFENYSKLVDALSLKYGVDAESIEFIDLTYDEDTMTYANTISVNTKEIQVYFDEDDNAYVFE